MRCSFRHLLACSLSFGVSLAHSWNEQLALIGPSGEYVGGYGYPRGYMARTDPGFNGYVMDWLLPPLTSGRLRIDSSDMLCHPSQRTQNQTSDYPRLEAAPGSAIAMKYLENGHVTLPQNQPGKPPKAGTVFVFGTTQPSDVEKLTNVMEWNSAGTGGDKRGFLITANNFDDGRCHQINSGAISLQRQQEYPDPYPGQPGSKNELWCQTNVILPNDPAKVPAGKALTLYWVWQWPTIPGAPGIPYGKDEYYTTCSDIDIVDTPPSGPISHTLVQQDPNTIAVADYKSRTAITPTPNVKFAEQSSWTVKQWASVPTPVNKDVVQTSGITYTTRTVTLPPPADSTSSSSIDFVPQSEIMAPAVTSSSSTSPVPAAATATSAPSTSAIETPVGTVYTALITVTATMTPGQTALVVSGTHIVTFNAPAASSAPARRRRGRR